MYPLMFTLCYLKLLSLKMLNEITVASFDENIIFRHRWSLFEAFLSEKEACNTTIEDETKLDGQIVSLLNLSSLNRGKLVSATPRTKLDNILSDKQRLCTWIQNYKLQLNKFGEKDSVTIATFLEAGTRLKMLLDHTDFDDGDLRIERRKVISDIDCILKEVHELKSI